MLVRIVPLSSFIAAPGPGFIGATTILTRGGTLGVLNLVPFILAAGGLLAVVTMVWLKSTRQVLFNVSLAFNQMVSGQGGGFDPRQSVYRMPYTVAIAGGMLANGLWLLAGARPLIHF